MYMYDHHTNTFTLVEKTEDIRENLNPKFCKAFIIDFIFEKEQILRFDVVDIDGTKD